MKHYTSTKTVMAEPMNELEAIAHGFARINSDNHPLRNGYHVQYNNPDGSIYDSLSPEDVFNMSYLPSETFLERLIIERSQLFDKITKLSSFVSSINEDTFSPIQLNLLKIRLQAMHIYLQVLDERIYLAKNSDK